MLIAGMSGGERNGTVAMVDGQALAGVCAQERVTRVRGAGFAETGWPDEALDLLLQRRGQSRQQVERYVLADSGNAGPRPGGVEHIGHHLAHACTAYLSSAFSDAAIIVCDHDAPGVTVWQGQGRTVSRVDWPWTGPGFADAYSRATAALGFEPGSGDQRLEALARLRPDGRDARVDALVTLDDQAVIVQPGFEATVAGWVAGERDPGSPARATVAAAIQGRIGTLLLEFLAHVRERLGAENLCLGGSLFYHSWINTQVRQSGLFTRVFVPIDPGNGGLAVGAALRAAEAVPSPASPFQGPSYTAQETKDVLDNCKLHYSWESEEGSIGVAVRALQQGTLVGWFDGPMEWGPRALGARCILANPTAPYVLENLNRFLKRREPWRGYALSGLEAAVAEHFDGPSAAPFMECDYRPKDRERFRHALPSPDASLRVQTVSANTLPRFHRLLEAFGEATGLPLLINTSFNGFHEPIVCSPRDAVRVFYGTGIDILVMNQFVLRK